MQLVEGGLRHSLKISYENEFLSQKGREGSKFIVQKTFYLRLFHWDCLAAAAFCPGCRGADRPGPPGLAAAGVQPAGGEVEGGAGLTGLRGGA